MDLISRQAALDALGEKPLAWTEGEYALGSRNQWQLDVDALKALPSAQPERKKGKWINHRNDDGHNIGDCSECGSVMQWFDPDITPNYCPTCGSYNGGDQE